MHFLASSKMIQGRATRLFSQDHERDHEDMAEPFKTAETRKMRWLVATSTTGLLGIATLSTVLFLTPEPKEHKLATRPLPATGMAMAEADGSGSAQSKSKMPARMASKLISGAGKQAMLKPAITDSEIKKTTARIKTNPSLSNKTTDSLGDAITDIGKLASATKGQNALEAPLTSKAQGHGDLISALKAGRRPPAGAKPEIANVSPTVPASADRVEDVRMIVGKGDTLYGLLTAKGVSPLDATSIISELKPVFSPRNLKRGQIVAMKLHRDPATGTSRPAHLELKTKNAGQFAVRLNKKGKYERIGKSVEIADIASSLRAADITSRKKTSHYNRARARIQSSFYQSALAQNLPPRIVNKMTNVLSYDVDFQREVNRGDTFEVLYSKNHAKDKGVLYAELVTNRKKHAFYRFKSPDGMINYYNKKGVSAQKTFMRTPVSGARITSRFGRRRHPILGYTKMHTGVDFGVARGTPIYAAASGKVQKAGWAGGYGKYVRIQHSKKLATAYAHMSRIARGLRPGKKVSQGQIIGYVGSTGRSTGPHLHYEIRVRGKAVNPMRYKLANKTKKLSRKWLALFKKEKSRIDRLRKQIPVSTNVASISN